MIYADELFARRLHSDVMENFDPRMWEQCNATLRVNRKALLMGGSSHGGKPIIGLTDLQTLHWGVGGWGESQPYIPLWIFSTKSYNFQRNMLIFKQILTGGGTVKLLMKIHVRFAPIVLLSVYFVDNNYYVSRMSFLHRLCS